ncbi:hypothetical protein ACFL5X_01105 [Candidatus Omnitrophota bacterium]
MAEVQKHGFIFEDWIKTILGVDRLASNYTQKWDIPGERPISVKCMGEHNALEFSSAERMWRIDSDFLLIVARWRQVGQDKMIVSIEELLFNDDILKKLRGDITRDELCVFDARIKRFPPGKSGQAEGIAYAKQWKRDNAHKIGLLTITHKIDSKSQRRVQCNLNYSNYVQLFGEPSGNLTFRGHTFNQTIKSGSRTFNK